MNKPRKTPPEKVAQGHKESGRFGMKAVCLFTDEQFSDVKDRAIDNGISFAQSVRELVEMGFLYEEDEK